MDLPAIVRSQRRGQRRREGQPTILLPLVLPLTQKSLLLLPLGLEKHCNYVFYLLLSHSCAIKISIVIQNVRESCYVQVLCTGVMYRCYVQVL